MSHPKYEPVTIESVDRALRDWFDKVVDVRVQMPDGLKKVPIVFSQGERWAAGRTKQAFRDSNGVLILPIISIRRIALDAGAETTTLGTQVPSIQIAKKVDLKTSHVRNLGYKGNVYDVYTIPFPSAMKATYELVIQTQYITQMNEIIQKMWQTMDFFPGQIMMPLHNDDPTPTPRLEQTRFDQRELINFPYVVGFLSNRHTDAGNFDEFTDQERIIKYTSEIEVPFVMQAQSEGLDPLVKVERTAYKVVIKDENCRFVDDPAELEKIFGPWR